MRADPIVDLPGLEQQLHEVTACGSWQPLRSSAIKATDAGLSSALRHYALRELARRGGVQPAFYNSWKIQLETDRTIIRPGPRELEIRIHHDRQFSWSQFERGVFATQVSSWPQGVRRGELESTGINLLVPFVRPQDIEPREPLFVHRDGAWECRFDLLLSLFLMLNRMEELRPGTRDEHGRYLGVQSLAYKDGFIERPILDELGVAFAMVLEQCTSGWKYRRPEPSYLLSHDIDVVGNHRTLRSVAGHLFRRKNLSAFVQDTLGTAIGRPRAFMQAMSDLACYALSQELVPCLFFKQSARTNFDSGYDLRDPTMQSIIRGLAAKGAVLGAHPAYHTYQNRALLCAEIDALRRELSSPVDSGRQHYLRWNHQTWSDWDACGMRMDSTLGFSRFPGFRCGTAFAFHPWLLDEQREARLLEVPLTLMDASVFGYQALSWRQGDFANAAQRLLERVKGVGGTFSLLIHNDRFAYTEHQRECAQAIDLLAGMPSIHAAKPYQDAFELKASKNQAHALPKPKLELGPDSIIGEVSGVQRR